MEQETHGRAIMYTVIRFSDHTGSVDLEDIGANLNLICPSLFDGMDRVPNRFSCTLCSQNDWHAHREAIFSTLTKCSEMISGARQRGVSITIDVAVDPENYQGLFILEIPIDIEIVNLLQTHSVGLIITVYGGVSEATGKGTGKGVRKR